jgi:hypothetical protein
MNTFNTELANAIRSMSDETLLELAANHLNHTKPKRKYTRRAKPVAKKTAKKRKVRRK